MCARVMASSREAPITSAVSTRIRIAVAAASPSRPSRIARSSAVSSTARHPRTSSPPGTLRRDDRPPRSPAAAGPSARGDGAAPRGAATGLAARDGRCAGRGPAGPDRGRRPDRAPRAVEQARVEVPRAGAGAVALGGPRAVRVLGPHRADLGPCDAPDLDAALSARARNALRLHPRVARAERGVPPLRPARAACARSAARAGSGGPHGRAVADRRLERRARTAHGDAARHPLGARRDHDRGPRRAATPLGPRVALAAAGAAAPARGAGARARGSAAARAGRGTRRAHRPPVRRPRARPCGRDRPAPARGRGRPGPDRRAGGPVGRARRAARRAVPGPDGAPVAVRRSDLRPRANRAAVRRPLPPRDLRPESASVRSGTSCCRSCGATGSSGASTPRSTGRPACSACNAVHAEPDARPDDWPPARRQIAQLATWLGAGEVVLPRLPAVWR